MTLSRRTIVKAGALGALSLVAKAPVFAQESKAVKMFKCLGCGHLGVDANQKQAVDYAAQFGFDAVEAHLGDLEKMSRAQRADFLGSMQSKKVRWGTCGLPVEFRRDEETFQKGIQAFPGQAALLKEIGVTGVVTWIMPGTNELTYLENFRQHARRLREAAKILKDVDLRLGLEFVGSQTLRNQFRYPFAHTQKEMLELCDEIGTGNMGLLFDSYHWFTSRGTVEEILALKPEQIVLVHINDARQGRSRDEQIDGERALPTATGVIDLKTFMNALVQIGYDGPVVIEPFDNELRAMDNEPALQKTIDAMNAAFALIEA
ncbi:MAG: sugar phosphate isomerase/epimerase family protein [bacterium]|jgi:sugar phosphate isomerase/epimerase|nr:sugar phosphate isomerase/epimerase family protein [bacterium]